MRTLQDVLEKLGDFIKNITEAWDQASQENRNRLIKNILDSIWIENNQKDIARFRCQ